MTFTGRHERGDHVILLWHCDGDIEHHTAITHYTSNVDA